MLQKYYIFNNIFKKGVSFSRRKMSTLLQIYVLRRYIMLQIQLYQLVSVVSDLWFDNTAVKSRFSYDDFLLFLFCWSDGNSFLNWAAVVESLSARMIWTSHLSFFFQDNIAEGISGSKALPEPTAKNSFILKLEN